MASLGSWCVLQTQGVMECEGIAKGRRNALKKSLLCCGGIWPLTTKPSVLFEPSEHSNINFVHTAQEGTGNWDVHPSCEPLGRAN